MGIMHILGQIRLEIPLANTINSKYILPFHLASERNKSMICLAAI